MAQHQKITLRGQIVGMKRSGASTAYTAQELGISQTTVHKWWKRWQNDGNLCDLPRSGGPRKTTPEDDRRIIQQAIDTPVTNTVLIREQLNLQVSLDTVRRRLNEGGIYHKTPTNSHTLEDKESVRNDPAKAAATSAEEENRGWMLYGQIPKQDPEEEVSVKDESLDLDVEVKEELDSF